MIVRYCVIFIAHLLVHGCALACVYRKHAAQVPHAPAAARFPLSPEAVDKDCALIAYAFGYDAAAFGALHFPCQCVHDSGTLGGIPSGTLVFMRPTLSFTFTASLELRLAGNFSISLIDLFLRTLKAFTCGVATTREYVTQQTCRSIRHQWNITLYNL